MTLRRSLAPRLAAVTAAVAAYAFASGPQAAHAAGGNVRDRVVAAFAKVKSYRLTVLGSVRSSGVFVAPDKYEVTTDIEGQPVRTVILGNTYYIKNTSGKGWTKSGSTSSLDADIAGIVRSAKAHPSVPFTQMPDQVQNGKKVGTFSYDAGSGVTDVCNYDPATYLVTRCRQDQLTILYSDFNDRSLKVSSPT